MGRARHGFLQSFLSVSLSDVWQLSSVSIDQSIIGGACRISNTEIRHERAAVDAIGAIGARNPGLGAGWQRPNSALCDAYGRV